MNNEDAVILYTSKPGQLNDLDFEDAGQGTPSPVENGPTVHLYNLALQKLIDEETSTPSVGQISERSPNFS